MQVTCINAAGKIYWWGTKGIDSDTSQTVLENCSQAGTGPRHNLASTAQRRKAAAFLSFSGLIPFTPSIA